MPELPEVETVCRGLTPVMVGRIITCIELKRLDLRYPFPPLMAERLAMQRVKGIERRAKYIQIFLDDYVLLVHLGMSGHFHPLKDHEAPGKHDHVVITLECGQKIAYCDPRRFGFMDLCSVQNLLENPHLKNLGYEPLGDELTPQLAHQKFSTTHRSIKTSLLDQRLIAGLGNIYVCESLWLAGISPLRPASSLTVDDWENLLSHIRCVLRRAIEVGGSSLKDHRQVNGNLGYFQHQFSVYDAYGRPCQRQGCQGTISKEMISNRSTYFCPQCQH